MAAPPRAAAAVAPRAVPAPLAAMPAAAPRRHDRATGGEAGADGAARAKLRPAGDEAVGDAGPEDAETEERKRGEHDRHRILDGRLIAAEAARELGEQRRADADDDGEHQHLDAGGDDVAEHPLGEERSLAEQAERDQHEAGERRQLELDQGDEELDREDEEGEQHHHPGEQQHHDLDEILEERDIAHQAGDRLKDRSPGVEPDLRDPAGAQKIGG